MKEDLFVVMLIKLIIQFGNLVFPFYYVTITLYSATFKNTARLNRLTIQCSRGSHANLIWRLCVAGGCSKSLWFWAVSKIVAVVGFIYIVSVLVMISETLFNEVSTPITNWRFLRENHFSSIQYGLISLYCQLRFIVTERLHSKQQLEKYHSYRPDVHL